MDQVSFYIGSLSGILVLYVTLWIVGEEVTKKLKYKFSCSLCEFRVSSNDKSVVTFARVSHVHHEVKMPY